MNYIVHGLLASYDIPLDYSTLSNIFLVVFTLFILIPVFTAAFLQLLYNCKLYKMVIFFTSVIIPFPNSPVNASFYSFRALSFGQLQDYERAVAVMNTGVAKCSKQASVYINRAYLNLQLRKYVAVIEDCERALALNPKAMLGYYNRGCTYFKMKDYARAKVDLERCCQLQPKDPRGSLMLSMIDLCLWEYEHAINRLKQGLRISPAEARYYSQLGFIYGLLQDSARSIECYHFALNIKHTPETEYMVYNNLGCIYFRQLDFSQAEACFQKVLTLKPDFFATLFALFEIAVIQQVGEPVVTDLRQQIQNVIDATPSISDYANLHQGVAAYLDKDYVQACEKLGSAVEDTPYNVSAHIWFCIACAALQQNDIALEALKHALRIEPANSPWLLPLRLIADTNSAFYAEHIQPTVAAIPPITSGIAMSPALVDRAV